LEPALNRIRTAWKPLKNRLKPLRLRLYIVGFEGWNRFGGFLGGVFLFFPFSGLPKRPGAEEIRKNFGVTKCNNV
jgi:hypothetical protein